MTSRRAALAATLLLAPAALSAQDGGAPLSAIDWLSTSVAATATGAVPAIDEPPVATGAATPGIVVTPLDGGPGPIGPVDPAEVGLPADPWAGSDAATLIDLLRTSPADSLPALDTLTADLLLARAAGPGDAGAFALARVDRLLDRGDLASAEALLRSGDVLDPEWFRRLFDVTLLRGTEDEACGILRRQPALAPTLEARVFCLARNGDWPAAALTLNTARALGDVTPEDDALLSHFLDPEAPVPPAADAVRPSPLVYRIREAVGEILPTTGLPLAFSHADLRSTVAWRVQIEAAERLARRDALAPEALRDIYLARRPAASGGLWDRAAAVQRLDAAVSSRDAAAAGEALAEAWSRLGEAGLRAPLARLYGRDLLAMGVSGEAAEEAGLLSDAWAEAAAALDPASRRGDLLRAVALGEPFEGEAPDPASAAVLAGLSDAADLPEGTRALADGGQVGEAILRAGLDLGAGLDGDPAAISRALATLRALGFEEAARRTGLEVLLLSGQA